VECDPIAEKSMIHNAVFIEKLSSFLDSFKCVSILQVAAVPQ